MSIRVMSAVWDLDLPDSEKLVALALADWCNDDGQCWPSVAQIARKCSKSVRTVQSALASLEQRNVLSRDMIAGKGTRYFLTPANITPRSRCTPAAVAPPQGTTRTPAAVAPNTSVTTIPSEANASSGKRAREKSGRGSRLSEDWEPSDLPTDLASDVSVWPVGAIERELSKFRDYWLAQPGQRGVKSDWQATWRNWIRKAVENGQRGGNRQSGGERRPADGFLTALREMSGSH